MYNATNATNNATTIKINGNNVGTINAGEYYTGKLTDVSCYIESDKPTHVFHITGFGCEVGGAVIPPIRCTGSTSVNVTRASSTDAFYVNVISPADIINDFKLNGSATLIGASQFQAIPGSGGKWMASRITIPTNVAGAGQTVTVENPSGKFHVGIIHGSPDNFNQCISAIPFYFF